MRGYKTIYILPNLITTAALFCGFHSILAAADGRFHFAAMLIFIAMIFDGMDGRVARLTHTESEFGVQYDSLSDLISFGVAPAMLLYEWSLHFSAEADYIPAKLGWMAAFIYAACGALRLARFNTQVSKVDKAVFIGLPSPAAAAIMAGYVWVGNRYGWSPEGIVLVSLILTVLTGLAMVSNIKYFSGKSLKMEGRVPFPMAVIPVIVLGLIFLEPGPALFGVFLLYGLHGPIWTFWRMWCRRRRAS